MDDIALWLGRHNVSLAAVLITIAIVIGASAVIFFLKRLLDKWLRPLEARLRLRYETVDAIRRIFGVALWLIVLIWVLEIWGISVGGFWTLLVSAATVVGVGFLATWAMVSNITASVFIAIWRPFQVGDTVEVLPEGLKGRIIDSNLMFVILREDGGSVIQVPNNLFFQKMFRVIGRNDPSLFEVLESRAAEGRPN